MRIRAKATGEEIDISDEAAKELIDAGIYEAVADQPRAHENPKAKQRRPTP